MYPQAPVPTDTVAAALICSDVVITMVGYPSDVREVILGADGVLKVRLYLWLLHHTCSLRNSSDAGLIKPGTRAIAVRIT